MPSSPPKKPRRMLALEATSSARPSEIIAKAVPPRRVDTEPKMMPKTRPARPPTIGIATTGTGSPARMTAFIACTAKKAPSP